MAPISSVYIYMFLGLTDTRTSYWLKWELFGPKRREWIITVSSYNLEGPLCFGDESSRGVDKSPYAHLQIHVFLFKKKKKKEVREVTSDH